MSIVRIKCNYLVQLAVVDGKFDAEERQKIQDLFTSVHHQEIQSMLEWSIPLVSLGAMPLEDGLDLIISMIDLMNCDQEIDRRELLFIQNQAVKLGFKKEVVEEL